MEKENSGFILYLILGLFLLFVAGAYLGCMIERKFGNPVVCVEEYV